MSESQLQDVKQYMESGKTFRKALIAAGVIVESDLSKETVKPLRSEFISRFGRGTMQKLRRANLDTKSKAFQNAMRAASRAAAAVRDGERLLVPIKERKRRREICMACPLLTEKVCSVCRCNIRLKTKLATEKCPEDKW